MEILTIEEINDEGPANIGISISPKVMNEPSENRMLHQNPTLDIIEFVDVEQEVVTQPVTKMGKTKSNNNVGRGGRRDKVKARDEKSKNRGKQPHSSKQGTKTGQVLVPKDPIFWSKQPCNYCKATRAQCSCLHCITCGQKPWRCLCKKSGKKENGPVSPVVKSGNPNSNTSGFQIELIPGDGPPVQPQNAPNAEVQNRPPSFQTEFAGSGPQIQLDKTPIKFKYYEPYHVLGLGTLFHAVFGWVTVKEATLPRFVIDKLKVRLFNNLTEINTKVVMFELYNSSSVMKYITTLNTEQSSLFLTNVNRYIMAYKHSSVENVSRVVSGAQLVFHKEARVKNHFKKIQDFLFKRDNAVFLLMQGGSLILILYYLWKYRQVWTLFVHQHMKAIPWLTLLSRPLQWVKGTPNCIFTSFYPLSIYIEELVKTIPGGWLLIGLLDAIVWWDWTKIKFHYNMRQMGFVDRLRYHLMVNQKTGIGDEAPLVEAYKSSTIFDKLTLPEEPTVNYTLAVLPPLSLPTPKPEYSSWLHATFENSNKRKDHREYKGFHPLCWGMTSLYKPAPSADNLQAAISFRVLAYPNSTMSVQMEDALVKLLPLFPFEPPSEEQKSLWFQNLKPAQKIRVARAENLLADGKRNSYRPGVFVKSDEMIAKQTKGFTPRLIVNVNPHYLNLLGCFTSELSKALALVWNKEAQPYCSIKGKTVSIYFACGATSRELGEWFTKAFISNVDIAIAVMGDDTIALVKRKDRTFLLAESDLSHFDRSVGTQALGIYFQWLRLLKCIEAADHNVSMYQESILWEHRSTRTHYEVPKDVAMRLTGEPATCLANSLLNGVISALAFALDDDSIYKRAGFEVKKTVSTVFNRTFLKGVFLPADQHSLFEEDQQFIWIRLPSFLCKFGKMLTDPLTLYPKSWSVMKKYRQALWSQWLGYGNMQNVWLYRQIGHEIKRLCFDSEDIPTPLDEYHVTMNDLHLPVLDSVWNDFVLGRYGLSEDDQVSLVNTWKSIKYIPCVYTHPMLVRLLQVDY